MSWLGRFHDFEDEWYAASMEKNQPPKETKRPTRKPGEGSDVKELSEISVGTTKAATNVVGVIIANDRKRSCLSKKTGAERHVLSFTLRDSPQYFVNVTCWGSVDYISSVSSEYVIGCVVKLKNVQVQAKKNGDDARFKPWTPVPYQLILSENNSSIEPYTEWDAALYSSLLTIPASPNRDYFTLGDINISGYSLQDEHINILAAVKKVGQMQYITTKTGQQMKKCEVDLFDNTRPYFSFELWQDHADSAMLWTPFETILFIVDARMVYSSFKSGLMATPDSKTIITVNPDTPEADFLRRFFRAPAYNKRSIDLVGSSYDTHPDLSTIKEVFTVRQIMEKRVRIMQTDASVHYGVVYAMITAFNVDSEIDPVVLKICASCKKHMPLAETAVCNNPKCYSVKTNETETSAGPAGPPKCDSIQMDFNIPVALSDYTGTINFCYLQTKVAEAVIGCKPQVFLRMNEEQHTNTKWMYLMEQCKVIFKLKKSRPGVGHLPAIQIQAIDRQRYPEQNRHQ